MSPATMSLLEIRLSSPSLRCMITAVADAAATRKKTDTKVMTRLFLKAFSSAPCWYWKINCRFSIRRKFSGRESVSLAASAVSLQAVTITK